MEILMIILLKIKEHYETNKKSSKRYSHVLDHTL